MGEHVDPRVDPWLIDESEFYEIESHADQMAFLIRYAVLAPSGHNAQPWSFRITHDGVEVFADYSRRVAIADPADRELMLSVGTAITNFRVAAAHFGYEATVLYQDRPEESLPVALIALRETCATPAALRRLFPAITARRTNRGEFETREIEPDAISELNEFMAAHSSFAHFLVPADRERAAELVEKADRILLKSRGFRNELADWVRPKSTDACDGICADGLGIPDPLASATPWFLRSFDVSALQAKRDRGLIELSAALLVITSEDDRVSLIRAGETLELLLLLLTRLHLNYSFINTPIEVEMLRTQLWATLRSPHPPQLLLRIGYARSVPRPQPRRDSERTLVAP
jgi:hypothetical protein